MPIMKLHDTGGTHYFPHPHRVAEIHDAKVKDLSTGKKVDGSVVSFKALHHAIHVPNISALKIKREIQENTEQDIGFLKLRQFADGEDRGNRYINVDHVIEFKVHRGRNDGRFVMDEVGHDLNAYEIAIVAPTDPLQVALQLRRVINRLDQDEELCCNAPPDAEAEAEAEDPAPA